MTPMAIHMDGNAYYRIGMVYEHCGHLDKVCCALLCTCTCTCMDDAYMRCCAVLYIHVCSVVEFQAFHGLCRCSPKGEEMCTPSWNQHIPVYCGSCWAHGALSMINDRLKIRKKGRGPDVMLSRQTLLNCGHYEHMGHGCDGGDVIDVFRYMAKFGLPDESCMTYALSIINCKELLASNYCCPAHAL